MYLLAAVPPFSLLNDLFTTVQSAEEFCPSELNVLCSKNMTFTQYTLTCVAYKCISKPVSPENKNVNIGRYQNVLKVTKVTKENGFCECFIILYYIVGLLLLMH